MRTQGKTSKLSELPEHVAADFLKAHLADGYYIAFTSGRIEIEWGVCHVNNPEKTWWRFSKP